MLRTLLALIFFSWLFYLQSTDGRQRVILIDSGITVDSQLAPYLCRSGHQSFVPDGNPLRDLTGHGTIMARVLAESLDPERHCILSFQTFDGRPDAEPYAHALHDSGILDAAAVLIPLEDKSFYLDEALWLRKISQRTLLFIAAGNDGKDLSLSCDVYPACLASQVDSVNFRVVGGTKAGLNFGGPINEHEDPDFYYHEQRHSGTSVSTARAVGRTLGLRPAGKRPSPVAHSDTFSHHRGKSR